MGNYCNHLKQAESAKANNAKAEEFLVTKEKLKSLNLDKSDLATLKEASENGVIKLYILPDNNLAVPSLSVKSHENPLKYLHVRNLKCPLTKCQEKRSKLHTLIKKEGPICLHTLLGYCAQPQVLGAASSKEKAKPIPKLDRDLTVKYILENIQNNFPTMSEKTTSFLVKNFEFTKDLLKSENISEEICEHIPSECHSCPETKLLDWPYPAKRAFFISMAGFKEIKLDIKTCPTCRVAYYPDLYSRGLFPVHNKFLLSYDFLLDLYNLLVTGSSLIENIEAKFLLLGKCNGYDEEVLKTNLSNNVKNIEKITIATISTLSEQ